MMESKIRVAGYQHEFKIVMELNICCEMNATENNILVLLGYFTYVILRSYSFIFVDNEE